MRNLKRALSMAMASVMLMGMSVVGTGAANVSDFSDVDSINNLEAVTIATGLGIFDGYDDGEFKPERVVTRAEMAVVIAKILHGADVDPATFVGDAKFTDVPAWAEGYVNLCDSLGIIEGYGDGKFGPNDPVTTVQANIMLLKALGYYTAEGDNLPSNWADAQLQATSKATALGFFGEKSLPMAAGLTREDVAELTFNALFAQRVAYDDVRGLHVKANNRNVVVTNGTDDELNTLANNTFGLYSAEGIVSANGMTDEALSADLRSAAQTTLVFTEDTDLDMDGKIDYLVGQDYDFEVESDLDFIGHAATVYYTMEKNTPVVFALVDQATLVEIIDNETNTTNLAKAANNAGFKKNSILDIKAQEYMVNFDADIQANDASLGGRYTFTADNTLRQAKKLVLISNSANKQVDEVIILDQYLDVVKSVEADDEETFYHITNDASDMHIAMDTLEEKDYVIVTNIGMQGKVNILGAANIVSGNISKLIGISDTTASVKKVVADGEEYIASKVAPYVDATFTQFSDIKTIGATTMVLDAFGELIGLSEAAPAPNYAYVAQYGYDTGLTGNGVSQKGILYALVYFADGTSGVYPVDLVDSQQDYFHYVTGGTKKAYTINKGTEATFNGSSNIYDKTADTKDITTDAPEYAAIGLWDVKVQSDGTVKITTIKDHEITDDVDNNNVQLVKSRATLMNKTDADGVVSGVIKSGTHTLYQNNDTVYFYVNGAYNPDASDNGLTVVPVTGVKNAVGFVNDGTNGIQEGYATGKTDANAAWNVETMLIEGITVGGATGVYYYDQGNYYVVKADQGYTLTYKLYDNNGNLYEHTYDNQGKFFKDVEDAKKHASDNGNAFTDGFYKIGAQNLVAVVDMNDDQAYENTDITVIDGTPVSSVYGTKDDVTYIVNAHATYDVKTDNLYDSVNVIGSIAETTKIVNLTTNGKLGTLAGLKNAIKNDGNVTVSYKYDRDVNNEGSWVANVLFVTSYTPDMTVAPGRPDEAVLFDVTGLTKVSGNFEITVTPKHVMKDGTGNDVTYTIYYSDNNVGNAKVTTGTYNLGADQSAAFNIPTGVTVDETANYYVEVSFGGETVVSEIFRVVK